MTNEQKPPAVAGQLDQGVRRVLHLTLKRRWFDMIASGVKREEYREMKPYWHKRLSGQNFDAVHFRNGYSADAPAMLVELRDIGSGLGVLEWGAPLAQSVYILRLGEVLKAPNVELSGHQRPAQE